MEIYGWIYKITNSINHKFYIGQTKDGVKFRYDRGIKFLNIKTGKELKFDSVIEAQHYFNEPNHVSFCRRCKGLILKPYKNKWKVAYIDYEYDKFDNIYIKRVNYTPLKRGVLRGSTFHKHT